MIELNSLKYTKDEIDFNDRSVVTKLTWDVQWTMNTWIEYVVKDAGEGLEHRVCKEEMPFLDYNVPMQVYRVHEYYHTESNKSGLNDLYICRRDEKPSKDTLTPFHDEDWSVWGIEIKPRIYHRKDSIESNYKTIITRNGEEFDSILGREMGYSLIEAQAMIHKLKEPNVPFYFWEIDFENRIIGAKCHWKGRPCTITSYIKGQNSVMLDIVAGDDDYDTGETIKDHILSPSFDWWREN